MEYKEDYLPAKYKVLELKRVGDYIFIKTDLTSFLVGLEECYDIGKYDFCNEIFTMGDNLVAVLDVDTKQELVNVTTKEVILSHYNSYYSRISKIDDDYVIVLGPEYDNLLFNIHSKKFVKTPENLDLKFCRKLGKDLFHFKHNDYMNEIYKNFVVNQNGEVIYECGGRFPNYVDDNLILSSSGDDNEVIIIHNFLESFNKIDILTKNKTVLSNPLVYYKDYEPTGVVFITNNKLKLFNFNLEEVKAFSLDVDADDYKIQLWGDIAVIIVYKDKNNYCISLNLNNGVQLKHKGIWILPLDMPGQPVIRGCDVLDNGECNFTLYNEDGEEYTHHCASDCFNVHSKLMNKYIYSDVDGSGENLIYNIDTKKEQRIPWCTVEYKIDLEGGYKSIGYGIRDADVLEDQAIDFIDEDLNIIFPSIKFKDFNIQYNDFDFDILNNLLLLILPKSVESATYFRKVVLDKQGNVLYDSYSGNLSFIGNFLQIVEDKKTSYIDSRDTRKVNEDFYLMNNTPNSLQLEGKPFEFIKKNESK